MATVVVKIAVAVDPSGRWSASGCPNGDNLNDCHPEAMEWATSLLGEGAGEARYWVTAVLQVPGIETVEGSAVEASSE